MYKKWLTVVIEPATSGFVTSYAQQKWIIKGTNNLQMILRIMGKKEKRKWLRLLKGIFSSQKFFSTSDNNFSGNNFFQWRLCIRSQPSSALSYSHQKQLCEKFLMACPIWWFCIWKSRKVWISPAIILNLILLFTQVYAKRSFASWSAKRKLLCFTQIIGFSG